jgi:hypothetical protein
VFNSNSHQPRREFLYEHKSDQRNSEPADEWSEPLRRNVRHEPPSTDDAGERGWNHLQDEHSFGALMKGADSKHIRKDRHRKNCPGGFSGREHARHYEDREHSQSAETCLRHSDENSR